MSLKDIDVKKEYRIPRDNVAKELYVKALKESTLYKRSVGFFTSSSLSEIAQGLVYLVENNGKMQLIISPNLKPEDIEAINKGYELREHILERKILDLIEEPITELEKEKLNLLSTLIAEEKLDIKIAFSLKNNLLGLYHEKMGLFYDNDNNIISFSGSMNETEVALTTNYETIDVFNSWENEDSKERTLNKEKAFEELWNNLDKSAMVLEFPDAAKRKLIKYRKDTINYNLLKNEIILKDTDIQEDIHRTDKYPKIPVYIKWRDYQEEATQQWKEKNYKGIFDMATGTGKTLTGLKAVTELSNELNNKIAVIIVCPYQHLVEQWVEDILEFNINPIIGYSASIQKNWKELLDNAIRDQKLNVKGREFLCFICTNATYVSKFVQEELSKIRTNTLLVVDEAHNFGAPRIVKTLDDRFKYRLALSATLERHHDEYGTNALYSYFGDKCIVYDLEKAIKSNMLTEYKYYPIIGHLTDDELEMYKNISYEIGKCIIIRNGKKELNEKGKRLAIKRASIVAGASFKIEKLKEVINPYKNDNHMLVYCGTSRVDIDNMPENINVTGDDLRQIEAVTHVLGNELEMGVSQFTSNEDMEERKILKEKFSEGTSLQTLIAIKCLDEGVNIPEIKTAFILASTTNPKEYIQRRGRVLRKAKGKKFAEIYDFITLPRDLEEVSYMTEEQMKMEKSLARNEAVRIEEFTRLSLNKAVGMSVLDGIRTAYKLDDNDEFVLEGEEYYGV